MNWKWHLLLGFFFITTTLAVLYKLEWIAFNTKYLLIVPLLYIVTPLIPDIDYIQGKLSQIILWVGTITGLAGILAYFVFKMSVMLLVAGFIIMVAVFIIATIFKHRGPTHSVLFCLLCALAMFKFFDLPVAILTFFGIYSHLVGDSLPLKLI